MEMRTKQRKSDLAGKAEKLDCYFDPECHKLVDWDGVTKVKIGLFERLKKLKSVDETKPLAAGVRARMVRLGVPDDRVDYIVTKWIKSVFKDYEPVQEEYEPARTSPKPIELHLDGFYFSFKTGGDPADVVDRFEGRTDGYRFTIYRNGVAKPMEWGGSFHLRGNELFGVVTGTVERNGDIVWSHGYTSRKESKSEKVDCYFDPECHKLVDWDGVTKVKIGLFERLKMMKSVDETKPLAAGVRARMVRLGVPDDRVDYIVTKWIKSVFKDYEPVQEEYEPARTSPKPIELHLDGFYFSFKTGGDPADVVDRFEGRTDGYRFTIYRNGPVGTTSRVDAATAQPAVTFQIRGNELLEVVTATVESNGDIVWSHGYTSRKERNVETIA